MRIRLFALVFYFLLSNAALAESRPDIVLFIADYVSYGDTEPYGSVEIHTPNLTELAREGVRFTNAYSPAPLCSPARAALFTARYPQRAGFERNIGMEKGPPPSGLASTETTITEMLQDAGYKTALFGKWHLGLTGEGVPNEHGFHEFFGFLDWSIDYYSHRTIGGQPGLYHNKKQVNVEGYTTDLFTDRAVKFIENDKGEQPLFVVVSYNAALPPHQPPGGPRGDSRNESNWFEGTREDYVKIIESVDAGIGRVLETLDNDALVIFTVDHGSRELGDPKPHFHGFRTLWEGGIRVPLIMKWPGHIPAGLVSEQQSINMDLGTTILTAASTSPARSLDGIDLVPVLDGTSRPHDRQFFWRTDYVAYKQKAVVSGRWKFILDDTMEMLFDLESDPGERHNLASRETTKLMELKKALSIWEAEIDR
jgi:arylsulfatase A-like enzyme